MAHFYGTVKGNRGEATRRGSVDSGIMTEAASWQGCVWVHVYWNESEGCDWVIVRKKTWKGMGVSKELYHGPIGIDKNEEMLMDIVE